MNHCAIQQNSYAACEEIWATADRSMERKETVVCPKPLRFGLNRSTLDPAYATPLRWQFSHQQEDYDAKAGNELLDIILGGSRSDQSAPQVASSPPFFSGSPPSRVSNPLIQDARFGDDKVVPVPTPSSVMAPSASSARKGCVRSNFGNNPAFRVEGFDCLDRDGRNCSIPALA
ncbi:uncharacterized protein LOC121748461 isoform X2 [Salvia splendens]|uniref:uncharacterized protein LOC121748461 isoform X2 n=1 Tax=Salvia splendens TaxID=180675 RepID=UPI001C27CBF8|nr:uncharacterized protein LOC121748461 isoform X2 [Salvia splendens]